MPLPIESQLAAQLTAPALHTAGKLFRAAGLPAKGAAQIFCSQCNKQILRRDRCFRAKRTAYIGRNHAHLRLIQPQANGHITPSARGRLRGQPQRERSIAIVPLCHRCTRL